MLSITEFLSHTVDSSIDECSSAMVQKYKNHSLMRSYLYELFAEQSGCNYTF